MGETASQTRHLDPASRRIGTVLDGKWKLERILGIGGMAAVYAATHRNGARAAIKLFPFSVTTSVEFAERILREGVLANKIAHPAVVRVLDDHLDREHEHAYLVMELLEGETARQRIERLGPMSPLEAVDFLVELLDCLGSAHEKSVIHRDIKPENLFLTEDGHLKVLDFGVARAIDDTSFSVTRTGAMLGTPAYMSPEQARGKPSEISPRSDIYSAGATLLFLVAGEFVHEGESAQEIMVRAAWTPAHKTSERGLGLPVALADVIDKACAFEQKDRYQSAGAMRRALESARTTLSNDGETTGVVRVRPPRNGPSSTLPIPLRSSADTVIEDMSSLPTRPPRARRRTWLLASGMALTALTSFLVFYVARTEAPMPLRAASPPPSSVAARLAAPKVTEGDVLAVQEAAPRVDSVPAHPATGIAAPSRVGAARHPAKPAVSSTHPVVVPVPAQTTPAPIARAPKPSAPVSHLSAAERDVGY
jgi:serine/threonine-protein kinase